MTPPLPTPLAAVEAMARALHDVTHPSRNWERAPAVYHDSWRADAQSALTALCALHPGIQAVLDGEAVVVPRDATPEMHTAGAMTIIRRNQSRSLVIYAAMLATSPYAPPAPGEEEKPA
jgi:hypothetical protein